MPGFTDILSGFETYDLSEEKEISLMKRIDRKYIFHSRHLSELLLQFSKFYKRLDVDNTYLPAYDTLYYDTEDFQMYRFHHNGKADRYKIRHRLYLNSNTGFLEIKHKNNLSIVKKTRIKQERHENPAYYDEFISSESPYSGIQLMPSISTLYNRITLANFANKERVTIDCNISFKYLEKEFESENLVICEIKKNPGKRDSEFERLLKQKRIKPYTLSKYCLGNYYLNEHVKLNLFKEKALFIKKLIKT